MVEDNATTERREENFTLKRPLVKSREMAGLLASLIDIRIVSISLSLLIIISKFSVLGKEGG